MKPQRMRMTHELIKAYELDKWMDVYVSLTPCRLPLEVQQGFNSPVGNPTLATFALHPWPALSLPPAMHQMLPCSRNCLHQARPCSGPAACLLTTSQGTVCSHPSRHTQPDDVLLLLQCPNCVTEQQLQGGRTLHLHPVPEQQQHPANAGPLLLQPVC